VAVVGGDLLARHKQQSIARAQEREVTDRVVVGDGQEVETSQAPLSSQLRERSAGVAVVGVTVEVAAKPARLSRATARERRLAVLWRPRRRRGALDRRQPNRDHEFDAPGIELVESEQDPPRARLNRTGDVPGCGALFGQHGPASGIATPASEARKQRKLGAARIDEPEVDLVAAERVLLPLVAILELESRGAGDDLERHHRVVRGALGLAGEIALDRDRGDVTLALDVDPRGFDLRRPHLGHCVSLQSPCGPRAPTQVQAVWTRSKGWDGRSGPLRDRVAPPLVTCPDKTSITMS
jgi:hypothetical protein